MGFWIFMFITVLLLPLLMIFFGRRFIKKAPDDINPIFGYRTERSMKNKETWEFAHKHFGKTWFIAGLVMLPVSAGIMLFSLGSDTDTVGNLNTIVMVMQTVALLLLIIPTEIALKKNFDKDGNRK